MMVVVPKQSATVLLLLLVVLLSLTHIHAAKSSKSSKGKRGDKNDDSVTVVPISSSKESKPSRKDMLAEAFATGHFLHNFTHSNDKSTTPDSAASTPASSTTTNSNGTTVVMLLPEREARVKSEREEEFADFFAEDAKKSKKGKSVREEEFEEILEEEEESKEAKRKGEVEEEREAEFAEYFDMTVGSGTKPKSKVSARTQEFELLEEEYEEAEESEEASEEASAQSAASIAGSNKPSKGSTTTTNDENDNTNDDDLITLLERAPRHKERDGSEDSESGSSSGKKSKSSLSGSDDARLAELEKEIEDKEGRVNGYAALTPKDDDEESMKGNVDKEEMDGEVDVDVDTEDIIGTEETMTIKEEDLQEGETVTIDKENEEMIVNNQGSDLTALRNSATVTKRVIPVAAFYYEMSLDSQPNLAVYDELSAITSTVFRDMFPAVLNPAATGYRDAEILSYTVHDPRLVDYEVTLYFDDTAPSIAPIEIPSTESLTELAREQLLPGTPYNELYLERLTVFEQPLYATVTSATFLSEDDEVADAKSLLTSTRKGTGIHSRNGDGYDPTLPIAGALAGILTLTGLFLFRSRRSNKADADFPEFHPDENLMKYTRDVDRSNSVSGTVTCAETCADTTYRTIVFAGDEESTSSMRPTRSSRLDSTRDVKLNRELMDASAIVDLEDRMDQLDDVSLGSLASSSGMNSASSSPAAQRKHLARNTTTAKPSWATRGKHVSLPLTEHPISPRPHTIPENIAVNSDEEEVADDEIVVKATMSSPKTRSGKSKFKTGFSKNCPATYSAIDAPEENEIQGDSTAENDPPSSLLKLPKLKPTPIETQYEAEEEQKAAETYDADEDDTEYDILPQKDNAVASIQVREVAVNKLNERINDAESDECKSTSSSSASDMDISDDSVAVNQTEFEEEEVSVVSNSPEWMKKFKEMGLKLEE